MSNSVSRAEELKAQANALHQKGEYQKARIKYSEAIREGDEGLNAVLYANRAASSLAMKEYLDAASDAKKAVALDPNYSKAWARLATANQALASFDRSIEAWEMSLSSLPQDNLSATENVLKVQYEAGLNSARQAKEKFLRNDCTIASEVAGLEGEKLPWQRALAMEKSLIENRATTARSSAWVILNAYKDFKSGVDVMKLTKARDVGGQQCWEGKPDIYASFIWTDQYNQQVMFEGAVMNGWIEGGAKTVQEEALGRLKAHGWGPVRPSLAITIRAWIMRGFLASSTSRYTSALEFLRRALDVLEWGRKVWKNVSREDRGTIFDFSFVRGVRRLLLNAMMQACVPVSESLSNAGSDSGGSLEDLAEMAHDMIAEVSANPPLPGSTLDPGFYSSFWIYPVADALSVLGFYHMQTALHRDGTDEEEAMHHFEEAAKYYIRAGGTLPEDDEHHAYFLKIGLEAHWWRGTPLRVTLPLCKRIRLAIPKMSKIWGFSQMTPMRDKSLQQALDFETTYLEAILEGQCTLDDEALPVGLMPASGEIKGKAEGKAEPTDGV